MKALNPISKACLLAAVLAAMVGCAKDNTSASAKPAIIHGERFVSDSAPTSVGRFTQAQAANGAQADSQLFDRNFHGEKLNSLGEAKLDLMLKATPTDEPVTVYLDMPHEQAMNRQPAIVSYLKDAGLTDARIKFVEGPNLDDSTPAAQSLATVYRPDGENASSTGSTDAPASAATATASAGGK